MTELLEAGHGEVEPVSRIWIVEDDEGARFIYRESLGRRFELTFLTDIAGFTRAVASVESHAAPDLVIVDLRLPDGILLDALLAENVLKQRDFAFLVVSSMDDEEIVRKAFRAGALDYMTKPVRKNELIVKVEYLLASRKEVTSTGLVKHGGISIDPIKKRLSFDGRTVALTPREAQLLHALIGTEQLAMERGELFRRVWPDVRVNERTLNTHMFNLRKKIEEVGLDVYHASDGMYHLRRKPPEEEEKEGDG